MHFGKSAANFDIAAAESYPTGRRTDETPKLPALFPKCMHCRLNWPEKGVCTPTVGVGTTYMRVCKYLCRYACIVLTAATRVSESAPRGAPVSPSGPPPGPYVCSVHLPRRPGRTIALPPRDGTIAWPWAVRDVPGDWISSLAPHVNNECTQNRPGSGVADTERDEVSTGCQVTARGHDKRGLQAEVSTTR